MVDYENDRGPEAIAAAMAASRNNDERFVPRKQRKRRVKLPEEFPPMIDQSLNFVITTGKQLEVEYDTKAAAIALRTEIYAYRRALRDAKSVLWNAYQTTFVADPLFRNGKWITTISPTNQRVYSPLTNALEEAMKRAMEAPAHVPQPTQPPAPQPQPPVRTASEPPSGEEAFKTITGLFGEED